MDYQVNFVNESNSRSGKALHLCWSGMARSIYLSPFDPDVPGITSCLNLLFRIGHQAAFPDVEIASNQCLWLLVCRGGSCRAFVAVWLVACLFIGLFALAALTAVAVLLLLLLFPCCRHCFCHWQKAWVVCHPSPRALATASVQCAPEEAPPGDSAIFHDFKDFNQKTLTLGLSLTIFDYLCLLFSTSLSISSKMCFSFSFNFLQFAFKMVFCFAAKGWSHTIAETIKVPVANLCSRTGCKATLLYGARWTGRRSHPSS